MMTGWGVKIGYWVLLLGCCWHGTSAPVALAAGIAFGILIGNPWGAATSAWSRRLLQASVIGLGFGVNLLVVLKTGRDAFFYTAISIGLTMAVGYLLGRLFRIPPRLSTLISFGTAICGGSAIAAMAPVIKAKSEEVGVALATVFTLNSIALMIFPAAGHLLGMDQRQFGLWAALAIHDTSSVVGATAAYGGLALAVGTTVKLTRALWIMPSSLIAARFTRSSGKAAIPLFIVGYLVAAAIRTVLPHMDPLWSVVSLVAKQSLVVTLFLIGSCLTRDMLVRTGVKPLAQGVMLWLIVSVLAGLAIVSGKIG